MTDATHATGDCRNCGAKLTGPWCSACGQDAHYNHAPTLHHFFHDLVHELAHVDGKLFRTLRALFFQPGKLTEEYWSGHVVSWIRPIRLFLVIVAIHLLAATGVGPLNFAVRLDRGVDGDMNVTIYSAASTGQYQATTGDLPEVERLAWFGKFEHTYNVVRYGSVVVFALMSWALYRRQQRWFVSHMIEALHFYSFWYSIAVLAGLLAKVYAPLNALAALSVIYLFMTLRRLYPQRWYWTLAKTAALFMAMLALEAAFASLAATWLARNAA